MSASRHTPKGIAPPEMLRWVSPTKSPPHDPHDMTRQDTKHRIGMGEHAATYSLIFAFARSATTARAYLSGSRYLRATR